MFLIEPLIGKMLLPTFGGSASVWNTCVVFFQITLLFGYCYAHLISTRLNVIQQAILHVFVIWLPILVLPIHRAENLMIADHPFLSLLLMLSFIIGFPFFAISSTAPLLQKWYSRTNLMGASDPYFLYAASNAGGLIGLLLYPLAMEPNFTLVDQSQLILILYGSWAALVTLSTLIFHREASAVPAVLEPVLVEPTAEKDGNKSRKSKRKEKREAKARAKAEAMAATTTDASIEIKNDSDQSNWRYYAWVLTYSLIPASLSLGLTTFVTTELSGIPFFWIVPLFLYLLSFVIAFSRLAPFFMKLWRWLAPPMVLIVLTNASMLFMDSELLTSGISFHLAAFFLVACACHSELAAMRPAATRLTSFYLLISVGGILGSAFNTFLAPVLFKDCVEYPFMLIVSGILLSAPLKLPSRLRTFFHSKFGSIGNRFPNLRRRHVDLIVVSLTVLLATQGLWQIGIAILSSRDRSAEQSFQFFLEIVFGNVLPVVVCFLISRTKPQLSCALAVVAIWVFNPFKEANQSTIYQTRNFYGSISVSIDKATRTCELYHGVTMHGAEMLDPNLRGKPISYYYPEGKIGSILSELFGPPQTVLDLSSVVETPSRSLGPIALMGLGAGSVLAYAKKNQNATCYEIDPEMIEVASNPKFFTFLSQARERKVDVRIVTGDGRLEIQKAPEHSFQIILMDAFSSDSVPTHLLTTEALQIYLSKLRSDGIIAFNITNRYYDLKPVLAAASRALNVPAFVKSSQVASGSRFEIPDSPLHSLQDWVLFSNDPNMQEMLKQKGWEVLEDRRKMRVWTDDYCSPLTVLMSPFS